MGESGTRPQKSSTTTISNYYRAKAWSRKTLAVAPQAHTKIGSTTYKAKCAWKSVTKKNACVSIVVVVRGGLRRQKRIAQKCITERQETLQNRLICVLPSGADM